MVNTILLHKTMNKTITNKKIFCNNKKNNKSNNIMNKTNRQTKLKIILHN